MVYVYIHLDFVLLVIFLLMKNALIYNLIQ